MNYRMFHQALEASGVLKNMPPELEYAVLRGFQTHDFLHVAAGYPATPRAEIALQAFSLAMLRFRYFAMWMSTVTARMTIVDPDTIEPLMDDISAGWQYGRRAKNISFLKWEEMLEQPLEEIRRDFGLVVPGGVELQLAA